MRSFLVLFLLAVLFVLNLNGQDTLPGFSAITKSNGKVLISWRNSYAVVTQISVQRSSDSLKNFTTLLTLPDPTIPENGFVDNKTPGPNMYYRLFILLEHSKYLFTKSKRAVSEDQAITENIPAPEEDIALTKLDNQRIYFLQDNSQKDKLKITAPPHISERPKIELEKIYFIKEKDSLLSPIPEKQIRQFRDSILNKTKDTILFVRNDTVLIKPFVLKEVKEVYKVSAFVFTSKDGNVSISLPDATRKKYAVRFFEQDSSPLLEIKEIKESLLIVDKTNFIHAGWFRFELYEDGKLKEKNRLFIPKEF
jgi:hypothetical protein